ncbi:hypothetical protein HUE58_05890 [Candidatus Ruthia endofausta]|uniref:Uncharacterized protein n=1 Tax=Candidatus Ruthia endofausta TaxID=2738852 RepID=A0A6N0HQM4_9GAMM|nr:hypothetical protein [Candidatus Ruthia endofausta]QKQ24626.1 hypothetical protein HUE58_05890 [Candidatus Ruthia endofausta]
MNDMLRPQILQNPKLLNWWPDEIKNYFKHKNYESYYRGEEMFFSITNEQSKFAWEELYKSVEESGDITNIIDEALSAWGYVEDAEKQQHLMTRKERQQHADELQDTLLKTAKDIKRIYKYNYGYFSAGDNLILKKITSDLDSISKSIIIPTLADRMNEKSTYLRGAVYLARRLEETIRGATGTPHWESLSVLISSAFNDSKGEFTKGKIRRWCRGG